MKESAPTLTGHVSSLGHVQPVGTLVGLAGVNVHHVLAVVALHGAAPLELALALGDTVNAHGVVAPPAAHDLTAVGPSRGLVAPAARCAQGTWRDVHVYLCYRNLHHCLPSSTEKQNMLQNKHYVEPVMINTAKMEFL